MNTISTCPAKYMSLQRKKRLALEAVSKCKTVSHIANENNTNSKFIRQQRDRAQAVIGKCSKATGQHQYFEFYSIKQTS